MNDSVKGVTQENNPGYEIYCFTLRRSSYGTSHLLFYTFTVFPIIINPYSLLENHARNHL
jgi:hypothetical protein